jgi:microcystin-dependent protein
MAKITYDDKNNINTLPSVPDNNKITDTDLNEIKAVVNTNTPTGVINMFAGDTAPVGWLICDGSAISRTDYANLFTLIGTTYGSGDGSTTFNLPNLKGKVVVGQDTSDTSFDTLGETGGEKTHTLTIQEMPSHKHNINYGGSVTGITGAVPGSNTNYGPNDSFIQANGGGQAHNNLQPYIVMNYIISY